MYRWYILRTTDGNALSACEHLSGTGLTAFTPTEYRPTMIGEEKVWQQMPSQPDLLFVYGTYDNIHNIIKNTTIQFVHQSEVSQQPPLTAHRSPLAVNCTSLIAQYAPITVPDDNMENLIRLVNVGLPQSYSVTDAEIHYRSGGPVRITDGPFKGVIGRVARIHTQTRVVVTIPGIISYATTYIPKHQMEPLNA